MAAPIAIIAGNGSLPLEICRVLEQRRQPVFVLSLKGEADLSLRKYDGDEIEMGQVGKLFRLLKSNQVEKVLFAGGVVGRPEISFKSMDFGALLTLPGLLSALLGGDNTLLTSVIGVFERRGFEVVSVADIVPGMTLKAGNNSTVRIKKVDLQRAEEGKRLCAALAPFDVGQACVVLGKRAVAVEGVEGTDAMLQRIIAMRATGRLPEKKSGVLVKALKIGQDERADLPTIGPATVEAAFQAGLTGIAVDAGKTLVLDKKNTLELASQKGLFIYAFEQSEDKAG